MAVIDQSADARRYTWESIKRRPEVAQLVRTDQMFQRLVGELVETFGPLEAVEVTATVVPALGEPSVTTKPKSAQPSNRRASTP